MHKNNSTSKFISLILRHKPEVIGITLDEHGWANVDELLAGISRTRPLDMAGLEEIVRTDEKQRYAFNADRTKIRANQGHSVSVDVELQPVTPPALLYHGTGEKYVSSIEARGLIPKTRLYVHLSGDYDTARMAADGYEFFRSVNGVWITKQVPPQYLTPTW